MTDRSAPTLILASQSPRRAQLLAMLGLDFEVLPADIDESYRPGEQPAAHARRLAEEKALRVAAIACSARLGNGGGAGSGACTGGGGGA